MTESQQAQHKAPETKAAKWNSAVSIKIHTTANLSTSMKTRGGQGVGGGGWEGGHKLGESSSRSCSDGLGDTPRACQGLLLPCGCIQKPPAKTAGVILTRRSTQANRNGAAEQACAHNHAAWRAKPPRHAQLCCDSKGWGSDFCCSIISR